MGAYGSRDNLTEGSEVLRLVVAAPMEGMIAEKLFEMPAKLNGLRLSPDGEKVFFYMKSKDPRLIASIVSSMVIWILESDELVFVDSMGIIDSFSVIMSSGEHLNELPMWSPDSEFVVNSRIRMIGTEPAMHLEQAWPQKIVYE